MTVRFSRRDALLQTAAMAAASAMPGALRPGMAAALRAVSRNSEIDAVLKKSVEAADVPGVVAMAATAQSVIYQGAFGVRGSAGLLRAILR
jgi:methyl acetate hydrolase